MSSCDCLGRSVDLGRPRLVTGTRLGSDRRVVPRDGGGGPDHLGRCDSDGGGTAAAPAPHSREPYHLEGSERVGQ
eukprot:SAG11_NODE_3367_length_2493_cov_12.740602_4_plen_75_part_00